jgi:MFS family permease
MGPAVLALTMGIGRLAGQVVVARTDEARLMRWGTVIGAVGMALAGLAPTPAWAYAGLVIAGLGGSVIAPTAYAAIGRMSAPDRRALVIARATALGYLGYFFGPPALGLISELFGLRVAFVAMAGMVLAVLRLYPLLIAAGRAGAAENAD